jgi:hypothetical protein
VSGTSALTVSNATLLSGTMVVLPSAATIPAGLAQQFTAFGDFSDGNTYDITTTVVWSSSNTGLATISNASGSQGLAAAIAAGGPVTITATYGGGGAGYTATASLTVSNAVLQSIALTPANPSVPKGVTQQFTATGNYSDASTFDLTNLAAWNSATTSVATINSAGLASAVNVGSSSISATYQGITGSTTLTVTSAVLQSITIAANPALPAAGLPAGITQSFVATGHYSDGSTLTLSGATWTSSNTAIATVNNSGLARTLAAGATNLSASLSGITGAFALTVNNATLSSIAVTPANATLAIGSTLQYTATGTYSNGTSFNITSTVTWSATPGNKVKITSAGVARRLRSGQATIRATSGAVTGTTKVF